MPKNGQRRKGSIVEWLDRLVESLARADIRAIVIALVVSWNGTQLVKHCPSLTGLSEKHRRFGTRILAFVLGFLPAFMLYPIGAGAGERFWVAIAVGLASPAIYTYAARALYHFFPWLEPKMSARPKK